MEAGQTELPGTVHLKRSSTAFTVLTTIDDGPVDGVRLKLMPVDGDGFGLLATSDDEGKATFDDLVNETAYILNVIDERYKCN